MNAENEIEYWKEKTCVQMMADMGIKPGDSVIDFGCSTGNYSIPLAYAVGTGGKVYAVDISRHALLSVRAEAGKRGLVQVEAVCPAYEDRLGFQDGTDENSD